MKFIDINIDREKIHTIIEKHAVIVNFKDNKSTKYYELKVGEKNFLITVFYKEKGLTTLLPQGQNVDLGENLCQKIYEELRYFDVSELNGSIVVKEEDFDKFINALKHKFSSELSESSISGGTLYKLVKSKEGNLNLSYYKRTKRLLVQGKAGKFLKIIAIELMLLGYNISNLISAMKDISLPEPNDVLKEYMPLIENKLPGKTRDITASSLQLLKINGNFSDYGFILTPIFRTLEHVMRKILERGNYEFGDNNSFIMFSERNSVYHLKLNENCTLSSSCKQKLELGYTYFNKNRNCTTHMDVDEMDIVKIETKEMAANIVAECIHHIEELSDDY